MTETEFTSYADHNNLYDAGKTIEDVISFLRELSEKLFEWFSDNQIQGNSGKYNLILSTNEPEKHKLENL